jgi:hypothetical protein
MDHRLNRQLEQDIVERQPCSGVSAAVRDNTWRTIGNPFGNPSTARGSLKEESFPDRGGAKGGIDIGA